MSWFHKDKLEIPAAPATHDALGRNDPCWCGSGQKFKKCHLIADQAAAALQVRRPDDSLVTVETYMLWPEAMMAKSYLESEGISVFLRDEAMGRIETPVIVQGTKLQVLSSDAVRARELLDAANRHTTHE